MKKPIGKRTILHPHPVLVVGTYDAEGKANMCTVAWGGICCSKPPAVAISLRAATHTHGAILHRKAFSVNLPSEQQVREADFVGISSGRDLDKFARTGLTAVRGLVVDAPTVAEFPVSLECNLLQVVELGLHTQFVGEIMEVQAEEAVLGERGMPDITKVRPLIYATGNRAYYGVGKHLSQAFTHKDL